MLRRPTILPALLAALIFALTGCGDSSDGGPMNPAPDPDPDPMSGAITGIIEDDLGDAMSGVTVRLRASGETADLDTRTTDFNGQYDFQDVEVGAYDVFIDIPDGHVLDGGANPRAVDVTAGGTAPADFAVRLLAGTVAGSVLASGTGEGVLDADVGLRERGAAVNVRTAQTNADGDYAFERVPVGDWDIVFSPPPASQLETDGTVGVTVADDGIVAANATLELLPVSLATHIQPVLTNRCATCHAGGDAPDGLELTDGLTYSETVNMAAVQLPSMDLIEPGAPNDSYLVHKIQGTQVSVGGVANRMPLGEEPLRDHLIEMIRRWTQEGAADN